MRLGGGGAAVGELSAAAGQGGGARPRARRGRTFLNASRVVSFRCLPMRVFHTSKGMPRLAASAIWMTGPIARLAAAFEEEERLG